MCPLLAQDPLHSIRPAHDVTSSLHDALPHATRWQSPGVRTCESEDGAAFVTRRVVARPSICFLDIRARPSQSSYVRERSDPWCRCGVPSPLVATAGGWCRWALRRRESRPVRGHCGARGHCPARVPEERLSRLTRQPSGGPPDVRPISCRKVSLSGTMSDGRSRKGGIWMSKTPRR